MVGNLHGDICGCDGTGATERIEQFEVVMTNVYFTKLFCAATHPTV